VQNVVGPTDEVPEIDQVALLEGGGAPVSGIRMNSPDSCGAERKFALLTDRATNSPVR
jgi:hypothetical protein